MKRLIEMHGGEVSAHSEGLGRGAAFTIRLPLVEQPTPETASVVADRATRKRVLVVDDNSDAARTLGMMLELDGHEVTCTFSGESALQAAAGAPFDIVLLDIGLPGMDGYEVARRLRALCTDRAPKIIALTGYGQPEDRARALRDGFDDHLVKPVSPDALLAMMLAMG